MNKVFVFGSTKEATEDLFPMVRWVPEYTDVINSEKDSKEVHAIEIVN